ncbi:MAG TPA: MlaD family protein [Verrucomicrobiae bacterium]|nr:MlaD family protein [Verrucomicrobiae bacterium]
MSEKAHGLPRAKVERSYLTWSLWLIPAIAAAVCGYFVIYDVLLSGPTIEITFKNGGGLQEKNTPVKYRGIKVGEVEGLKLVDHGQNVLVTAKLSKSAEELARQGSQFWVVRPQFSMGGISGLRTIVAGNYVNVQAGTGPRTNKFIGAEGEPIKPVKAVQITLLADDLDSVQKRTPIFYRGMQVGVVMDVHFSQDSRHIVMDARIKQEYAPLVRQDSVFWNAGGINVHAGLFSGVEVSAESAQTVISGGIAFGTPDSYGPQATNGTVFVLHPKEDDAWKNWNPGIPLPFTPSPKTDETSLPQGDSQ